jgi:hypothetical protein
VAMRQGLHCLVCAVHNRMAGLSLVWVHIYGLRNWQQPRRTLLLWRVHLLSVPLVVLRRHQRMLRRHLTSLCVQSHSQTPAEACCWLPGQVALAPAAVALLVMHAI